VAASAECRKSVAVGIAKEVLEAAKIVPISAERITNADLLKQLFLIGKETGNSEMLIWADELRTFLSTEDTHKGVITTLTRLYASPANFENRTKTAGVDFLVNVSLNMLVATTPTDLIEIIPGAATGSGFVPRLHLVFAEHPRERVPWPEKDPELKRKLVEDLIHIRHTMSGEYKLAPEAKAWWDDWYQHKFEFPPNEQLNGFYGRKHDYVLKLGMVMAASDSDEMVVKKEHLEVALQSLDIMEAHMVRIYEMIGTTPTLKYADVILAQIRRAPKKELTRAQIQKKNWNKLDAEALSGVLSYLESGGRVKLVPLSVAKRGIKYVYVEEEE
jgi:hypothetical protein